MASKKEMAGAKPGRPYARRKVIAWHYTTGIHFQRIDNDGELRPIPTNGAPPEERPVIWFSTEAHWEPTASKAWRNSDGTIRTLSMTETFERGQGLWRIGVDPDVTTLHDFDDFMRLSGIPEQQARGLKRVGRDQGANPRRWFVSFEPIPRYRWAALERYDGSKWTTEAPKSQSSSR